MMKKTLYTLSLFLIFACNTKQNEAKIDKNFSLPKDDSEIKKFEQNFDGTWGLTNYFDSIIKNKELAKYRVQPPTWFAILLRIKNDSLTSFGSLIENEKSINLKSDTLTHFDTYGGKWSLTKSGENLILKQFPNQKNIDSTTYIYCKRNDLRLLTQEMDKVHKISSNITEHFNLKLFSGNYTNKKTNKEVVFKKNGQLTGIDNFDSYEVRNYFGTLHPHNNLDVITFIDSSTNEYKQLNWKFNNDVLTLTEFIPEIVNRFGKKTPTDNFVLGKKKIELKAMKKH